MSERERAAVLLQILRGPQRGTLAKRGVEVMSASSQAVDGPRRVDSPIVAHRFMDAFWRWDSDLMGLVPVSSPFIRLMNFFPLTRCSRYVPMAMGCRWAAKSVKRIPGVLCAPR